MPDRTRARLFDREAERYDRTRPGYPDELVDEVLGPSPGGLSVLDVACGTGIAARAMARRGADVRGVDLNPGMAAIAQRHGIPTEVAAFETWDPAGRTFDRVTCAQAWHWLDPDVSARKIAFLLRPDGRVCLFWNVGRHPGALADALRDTYARALRPDTGLTVGYSTNGASKVTLDFGGVARALAACDGLDEPRTRSFPWVRTYSRDQWLDELLSHSDHTALPPELQQHLFDAIGATIDRFGGTFRMHYVTVLISARRR
ncbi:MAG TPA: class I SAM-dependent methyltransferase [Acidimicrobiia bacterium]